MERFTIYAFLRDDGARLEIDDVELFLAEENELLPYAEIETTDVAYTDADGGEMVRQRRGMVDMTVAGLIRPVEHDYWDIHRQLTAFFLINHTYTIIYKEMSGRLFMRHGAWLSRALEIPPRADETYSPWTVELRCGTPSVFEYAEDEEKRRIFANKITIPTEGTEGGGSVWNERGSVWTAVGRLWDDGRGAGGDIMIHSTRKVYPVWTVKGEAVQPTLTNTTTDETATYAGTVAEGQTLVVDFQTGEARLDGALVSRYVSGVVGFLSGHNTASFRTDGGACEESSIEWNNVIGG